MDFLDFVVLLVTLPAHILVSALCYVVSLLSNMGWLVQPQSAKSSCHLNVKIYRMRIPTQKILYNRNYQTSQLLNNSEHFQSIANEGNGPDIFVRGLFPPTVCFHSDQLFRHGGGFVREEADSWRPGGAEEADVLVEGGHHHQD